ncbi:hypothetical protein CTA2_6884 [Colletotrichum tanaceti]|uniref:Uncharacterized protein n=1 Tax=Colletotrichum tanaceti TaxID=1306861 RepID=A0A4U6XIT6_9PEZI|nr:hypothetical protein CTA2_6884 [Colletotrichum tanaceti]TKW55433.1 hypothetical protein CTA1_9509 [Colletotrichum tanaceti]
MLARLPNLLKEMASSFVFLRFPRELRDMVYEHYSTVAGGYVCDSQSFLGGKLRGARDSSRRIDLDLIFTCRQVAAETKGLPFRANTVTFQTIASRDIGVDAAQFDFMVRHVESKQNCLFRFSAPYVPSEAHDELKRRYPQFAPLLDYRRADRRIHRSYPRQNSYGEAPSVYRELYKDTLQAVSLCDPATLFIMRDSWPGSKNALRTLTSPIHDWSIPSQGDMSRLFSYLDEEHKVMATERQSKLGGTDPDSRVSAAAVAIYFIGSLPAASRMQLRDVVLDEDHKAVALPECHGRGLVPLCQKNPQLRVQRRLNLWENFFSAGKTVHSHETFVRQMTESVSRWMVEARALPSAGMPAGSFSLLLDGSGPVSQHFHHVFQSIVQRHAAWQLAWTASQDRREPDPLALSWCERRGGEECYRTEYTGYFYEDFPAAMRDVGEDDPGSIVRCNFDVGKPWDIGSSIPGHQNWGVFRWNDEWKSQDSQWWHMVSSFCTN